MESYYLYLPIKSKWLSLICSGVKDEEYRSRNPYWNKRIAKTLSFMKSGVRCFARLHQYKGRYVDVPIKDLYTGYGKPELGAPEDEQVNIIALDVSNEEWKDGRQRFHIPFYLYVREERKWIDLICSGYKDEKYVSYLPYWLDAMEKVNRLINDHVPCYARLATRDNKRQIVAPIKKIRVGIGKPEMGAPRYSPVYILELDVSNIKIKEL